MSRVFEALTRAGQEKKEKEANGNLGWVLTEEPKERPISQKNGKVAAPFAQPTTVQVEKTWREKIEDTLLGWGLGRYENYPLIALEKGSPAAEQYKILREKVKRLRSDASVRTLALTSPLKRDGKTTVAVNLAATLALDFEEQVLLIDGDLRDPEVHRYFGIQPGFGLADYLTSNTDDDLASFVHETSLPNLKIIPAGKPSDASSELLAKLKMRNLMDEIKARFPGHQIVVDTPPVLATSDPLVLAGQVDALLMVVRAGKTPREYLLKAVEALDTNKLMGIILNGAELNLSSKNYYYYYHANNGKE